MQNNTLTKNSKIIGTFSSWILTFLLVTYAFVLILGIFSLQNKNDQIGNPYFTILEVLIILMMIPMIISIVTLHLYASEKDKIYSLLSLTMIVITTVITSLVHFLILTLSRLPEFSTLKYSFLLFSFQWPSIVYSLDILAWDWFFPFSMLFASKVFHTGIIERIIKVFCIISGILSLIGLIGIPMSNMQIRMIGVIGYVGVTPFIFFLMGVVFRKTKIKE